jgi:hypothetical protein
MFEDIAGFLFINSFSQLPFGGTDDYIGLTHVATNPFLTTTVLPNENFKADLRNQPEIKYNDQGEMLLQPGDYVVPVMTFCLKHNADSPRGYIYTLNKMQGSAAQIIRQLNLRALLKYKTEEIQNFIWNITGGLSYSEMDVVSQKIINETLPEYKKGLEKSYYFRIKEKWNSVAEKSHGIIPNFESETHDFLSQAGSVGIAIDEVKDLHDRVSKKAKYTHQNGDYCKVHKLWKTPYIKEMNRLRESCLIL